jgi:hypothetical protein
MTRDLTPHLLTPEELDNLRKRPSQVVFTLDLDETTNSYSIRSYGYWYPIYTDGNTVKEALAMAIDFINCMEAKD